jgi:phage tail-like protein
MARQVVYKLILNGPDLSDIIDLSYGITTLGRVLSNDVPLPSPKVSREHATIELRGDRCSITDLGSSNGTYLNGERIEPNIPVQMLPEANLEIGPYKLKLVIASIDDKIDLRDVIAEYESERSVDQPVPESERKITPPDLPPPPPPGKPPIPPAPKQPAFSHRYAPPPGLSDASIRMIDYLPAIYREDFVLRFLAMFESLLIPIEWNADNFDLYLDPTTTQSEFLSWIGDWFAVQFDASWTEDQQRMFLKEVYSLYARRGTPWALWRLLGIYTGCNPEIDDQSPDLEAHTFRVRLPIKKTAIDVEKVKQLIEMNKPAHTSYFLEFKE